jgi:hypothetical protein
MEESKWALEILCSVATALSYWALAEKKRVGWLFALASNVLWWGYTLMVGAWGLVPLNAFLLIIYIRGLHEWDGDKDGER